MMTVCAWCDRYLGPENAAVTHGICAACTARQHWRDTPVLVVPPHRESIIPVLRHLLQGSPEIKVVLERRTDDRRQADPRAAPGEERRSGRDRRRRSDLLLV
jgi:hypothetical protein